MILLTLFFLMFAAGAVLLFLLKLAGALLYWPLKILGRAVLIYLAAALILSIL